MTKTLLPLAVRDLSDFTRKLSRQLGAESPSHLTLMNMLARSAGHANVQDLRARQAAGRRLERPAAAEAEPDARLVARALNQFDATGRLMQWPSRRAVQDLALWSLWADLPARRALSEIEVNVALSRRHGFDDPATLRRCLIGAGLLIRRVDGSEYRRVERAPTPEARVLIRKLSERTAAP